MTICKSNAARKLSQAYEPLDDDVRAATRGQTSLNLSRGAEIIVARWTDKRMEARRAAVAAPGGQFVLDVALAPTRVRLVNGRQTIFDGMMASGMTYVCRPCQTLYAELVGPADFLRLYVARHLIDEPHAVRSGQGEIQERPLATMLRRDPLVDHLARAVQTAESDAGAAYVDTLLKAIVVRTSQMRQRSSRISPLPQWRLKRVVDYIEANISEVISLSDLASAAGLSRTHFTAQFRLATGCKPHEFVLVQRIEMAKRLLVESRHELVDIALSVGFQAQAHFSTVFKRFVGDTPGHWRRGQLAGSGDGDCGGSPEAHAGSQILATVYADPFAQAEAQAHVAARIGSLNLPT